MDKKSIVVVLIIVLAGCAIGIWQNSKKIPANIAPFTGEPPIEEQIASQFKAINENKIPPLPIPVLIQGKPLPSMDFEEVRSFLKGLGYKEWKDNDFSPWFFYTSPMYQEVIRVAETNEHNIRIPEHLNLAWLESYPKSTFETGFEEFDKEVIASAGTGIGVTIGTVNVKWPLKSVLSLFASTPSSYINSAQIKKSIDEGIAEIKNSGNDQGGIGAMFSASLEHSKNEIQDVFEIDRGIYGYHFHFVKGRIKELGVEARYFKRTYKTLKANQEKSAFLRGYFNVKPGETTLKPEE